MTLFMNSQVMQSLLQAQNKNSIMQIQSKTTVQNDLLGQNKLSIK